jgi:tRNA A37 threonylcarbamoyladenosine dehydratase
MNAMNKVIKAAKTEILQDLANGVIPEVKTFEDLHDYVDANEYGMVKFNELHEDVEDNWDYVVEFMDDVQIHLNLWIKYNGLKGAK